MNDDTLRAALDRGLAAHRSRRLDDAVAAYREALALAPADAEANSLAGNALAQLGQYDEALALLRSAVDLEPTQPGLRFNLAQALIGAGQCAEALVELEGVVAVQPGDPTVWVAIGRAAEQTGDDDRASAAFTQALSLDPDATQPAARLALLAIRRAKPDQALSLVNAALARSPSDPALLDAKCAALITMRRWAELEQTAREWTSTAAEHAAPWQMLSRAAFERGRYADAVAAYARYLSIGQHDVADVAAFAGLALHALDFEAADAALAAASEMSGDHPEVLARRALLDMYFGRFDAAEAGCRRVLERYPQHVPVLSILGRLHHGHLADAEIATARQIAQNEQAVPEFRIPAAFALGQALDARDDIDAAFSAYSLAHELSLGRDQAEGRVYAVSESDRRTTRLLQQADAPPVIVPTDAPRPIFVIGLPRSGTTLVEAVLGAHSRVQANGERVSIQQLLRQTLELEAAGRGVDEVDLARWAEAYRREVRCPAGVDHITDKHPLNYMALGLITRLFPDAAIVVVTRDPLETGLSIWRQEFAKSWSFVHRLGDIGVEIGHYARLLAHWRTRWPNRFIDVRYESFADDFEHAAPALVRACGLPWEPQCLDLARAPQPIATFSSVEARGPVSTRRGRAARYGARLDPLREALVSAGVDLDTGQLRSAG